MNLFEITEQLQDAIEDGFEVDPDTGELMYDPEALDLMDAYDTKMDGCIAYVKNQRALIDAMKAEEDAMRKRRQSAERQLGVFRRYVAECMGTMGYRTYQGVKGACTVRPYSHVEVDETYLPRSYMKETVKYTPDKAAIRQAIEGGEEIPGARIVDEVGISVR